MLEEYGRDREGREARRGLLDSRRTGLRWKGRVNWESERRMRRKITSFIITLSVNTTDVHVIIIPNSVGRMLYESFLSSAVSARALSAANDYSACFIWISG